MSSYSLFTGDNVEVLRREVPDESIQLTVTSPPYDNLRTYNGFTWDFEGLARELYRVTKKGGVVVWVVADATVDGSETGTSFRQALYFKECGFNLHDTMIYQTNKPPLTSNRYEPKFEYMFVFSKGKPNVFNGLREKSIYAGSKKTPTFRQVDGTLKAAWHHDVVKETKLRGNIWYITRSSAQCDEFTRAHPATFPEELAQDHIISWSNPDDIVLDTFVGSGTTGKMAVLNNRNFIGCDISPEYVELSEKRIKSALEQKRSSATLVDWLEELEGASLAL